MRSSLMAPVIIVFTLFTALSACSGSSDQGQRDEAILEELKQIRAALERIEKKGGMAPARQAARPTRARLSTKARRTLGKDTAPITIVEVSDYQCPFCKRFVENTLPELKKAYIDTGKVRLVFKDLPLGFHKHARKAAQAAQCAGDQGKFWPMHDRLFAQQKRLEEKFLPEHAKEIGLNPEQFTTCLNSKRHLAKIDADAAEAQKAGLTGTPSFVIGKTTDNIVEGEVIRGAVPIAQFRQAIDKLAKTVGK